MLQFLGHKKICRHFMQREVTKELTVWQRRKTSPVEWTRQPRWSYTWSLSGHDSGCADDWVQGSNSSFDFSFNAVTPVNRSLITWLTPCNHFHLCFSRIHINQLRGLIILLSQINWFLQDNQTINQTVIWFLQINHLMQQSSYFWADILVQLKIERQTY